MKKDIRTIEDIRLLVDSFYGEIKKDDLLGPIFNGIIQDRWDEHLEKMYRFWQTVLLDEHTYFGSPFMPHAKLPVQAEHFDKWVGVFKGIVDRYFEGTNAEKAKGQGERMAKMFQSKIAYYQNNDLNPLI